MDIIAISDKVDNGRSKIQLFDVDGKIIEWKYNYGKGWGFLFLTKFKSLDNYHNRMTQTGQQMIYSSTNQNDCTPEGRAIEFAIMKMSIKI